MNFKVKLLALLLILFSCHQENRINHIKNEAIWIYYLTNHIKSGVICSNGEVNKESNISFYPEATAELFYFGDTIEAVVSVNSPNSQTSCRCINGVTLDIFGFYPNSDTVSYRSSTSFKRQRRAESDSTFTGFEWMGVLPIAKSDSLFRIFLKNNQTKLNLWLKKEARSRAII